MIKKQRQTHSQKCKNFLISYKITMLPDQLKAITKMEAAACTIGCNSKRHNKVDEMMRYTKAILGERDGKPSTPRHIGRCDYNRRGELIGFYLEPLVKEVIKQF